MFSWDILGPAAYEAYRSGAVKLEDFVGRRHDRRLGSMRYTRSLRDILGAERGVAYTRLAKLGAVPGGKFSEADRLILEAATGARRLSRQELQQVLEHVARAGFDPNAQERARGELTGMEWHGQVLRGSTVLPPMERHYLKHALLHREWPEEITLEQYVESIRQVILDPKSGIVARKYEGTTWQLAIVRRSEEWRGAHGRDWILVDYRLETGHWQTAYQFDGEPDQLLRTKASDARWFRRPR